MGNGIRVRATGGTPGVFLYAGLAYDRWVGWAVAAGVMWGERITGPSWAGTVPAVPGRAARQAGVAAHAQARCTGRVAPGTWLTGPCRVWAVSFQRAFGRAAVHQARWTSILLDSTCRAWTCVQTWKSLEIDQQFFKRKMLEDKKKMNWLACFKHYIVIKSEESIF
jgi:hypothetical protein